MTPSMSSPTPERSESASGPNSIEDLVAQCVERFEREGLRALDEVCRAHPTQAEELRRRIRLLGDAGLLGGVAESNVSSAASGNAREFGHYQMLRELGRGGMGVVYLARDMRLGRDVALKMLPPHVGRSAHEVERFRREVRALASLKHPGIVQVYDGAVIDGTAYFTMEHVEGRSLADATRQLRRLGLSASKLETREFASAMFPGSIHSDDSAGESAREAAGRSAVAIPVEWGRSHVEVVTRITIEVARALQHVHEHGVLHRDVKPSNILIDSSGRIRLIDFGLARIDAEPEFTRPGDFLGTPTYVAPEQIKGTRATVDARTDVYSLGVTLYELLTLRVPFEGSSTHELIQRITRSDPPAPRSFNARIPRDLETVCLTAMEKDPKRRYASAGDLAADLQRALEFRPIRASPIGPIERLTRVVRRNPASSLAAALASVILVGIPSFVAVQQTRAAESAQQVLDWALDAIAQNDPFSTEPSSANESGVSGPTTSAASLDRLAAKIEADRTYDAATRVKVSTALGRAYRGRGFNDRSMAVLGRALDLAQANWGEDSAEFAAVEHELGVTLRENGDYAGAAARLEAALGKRERLVGAHTTEVADTLHDLAWVKWLCSYGRGDEAGPLFQRALELRRELLGDAYVSVAETRAALAVIVHPKDVDGNGLEQQEEALRICRERLSDEHPRTTLVRANMGQTARALGDLAQAQPLLENATAAFEARLGTEHPMSQWARHELYEVYYERGRYSDAERVLRSCLPDKHPRPGSSYAGYRNEVWELAMVLAHESRFQEAEELINWAFSLPVRQSAAVGEQCSAHSLAVMAELRGQFADAASFYATALDFSIATQGATSRVVASDMVDLAITLRELGDPEEAGRRLQEAINICTELGIKKGARYPATAFVNALEALAQLRVDGMQYAEAADLLRESLRLRQAWFSPAQWAIGRSKILLGACLARVECCEEAEALVVDGFRQLSTQLVPEHVEYRRAKSRLESVQADCAALGSTSGRR